MKVFESLRAGWCAISIEGGQLPGTYERRVLGESGRSVFVCITIPSRLPSICLYAPSNTLRSWRELETRGFRIVLSAATDHNIRNATRVKIELVNGSMADIFEQLCEQVVSEFVESTDDATGSEAAWRRLIHWQRFFETTDQNGLTAEEQTGLYGELAFIRRAILHKVDAARLIAAWQGPAKANQDFAFGPVAVEVKTTAAVNSTKVSISNIKQLDDNGIPLLALTHVSVDRRRGAGETLPQIIEEILEILVSFDGLSASRFSDCLLDSGYSNSQADLYEEFGFTLRTVRHFRVNDGFPRILEKDLAPGISGVSYTIELSAATDFLISDELIMGSLLE